MPSETASTDGIWEARRTTSLAITTDRASGAAAAGEAAAGGGASRGNTTRSVGMVTRGLVVFQIGVTCVLLIGADFPRDAAAEAELLAGLPFINLELVDQDGFRQFTERTFATDRNLVPKGMVEVIP